MKAAFVPLNGDPPIAIGKDVSVLGRRDFCDIRVDDPSLSKRHCVIVKTDGLLIIRDLATTNGTKVNGQRIRWAALLPNDKVTFGAYKVRVYLGSDEAPSPADRDDRLSTARNGVSNSPSGGIEDEGFSAPSPPEVPVVASKAKTAAPRADSSDEIPWPQVVEEPQDVKLELDDDDDDEPAMLNFDDLL